MLVSRPGAAARMVGRADALGELSALLDQATHDRQPVVAFVHGEAGVGKTRLLREVVDQAPAGTTVVAGQAREGEGSPAFALVRDALESHLPGSGDLPEAMERWRHPLAHLLHPLVTFDAHPTDGHAHTQEELARSGVAFVRHAVGAGPGALIFEDLHWADAESLEVFARLARSDAPLLLVGTFRPEDFEGRRPVAALLGEVERLRLVHHLRVDRLSRPELAALLEEVFQGPVHNRVVERLHERTQGNPFFVEELLAGAISTSSPEGGIDAEVLVEARLPWNISEAVRRRLDDLDDTQRSIVRTAAALGVRFELPVLAEVTEVGREPLLERLRSLVEVGLLAERGVERLEFRHALTREAIGDDLLEGERRAIHERALAALVTRADADPATLAHHAVLAGRDDEAAAHARVAAVRALESGTPRQALRSAQLAFDRSPADVELLETATVAAARLGDHALTVRLGEQCASAASEDGRRGTEAVALARVAHARWRTGDPDGAAEPMRTAVAIVADLPATPQRAEVLASHAQLVYMRGEGARAVALADEAIEIAEQGGHRHSLVWAWMAKADGIVDSLDHQAAEFLELAADLQDRALEESQALGDVDTALWAFHSQLVPDAPVERSWEYREARLAEAREFADRYGLERMSRKLPTIEVFHATVLGDLQRAEEAMRSARRVDLAPHEAYWRASLEVILAIEHDDEARVARADQEHRKLVERSRLPGPVGDLARSQATLAAWRDEPTLAEQAFDLLASVAGEHCLCGAADWWETGIEALRAGVPAEVVRDHLERHPQPRILRHAGLLDHLEGALLAAEGDVDEAVHLLPRATEAPQRGRRAVAVADAHRHLAELLAGLGERAAARRHVTAALELLAGWPGTSRERIEALGRRLGAADDEHHGLFTGREMEVVDLLVRGYSNAEIAERLFIAPKTASVHVSNILRKTGFQRRGQVAAWALEQGILRR